MRKLTATLLSTTVVAGVIGTGAALAATPHSAKPAAVATDRASHDRTGDKASRDRLQTERASHLDRSHAEAHSAG